MAAVRNLGLFPSVVFCPRQENLTLDSTLADLWIESVPPFLYACAHYWRVRTWLISASATWTEIDGGTVFSTSFSDTLSQGIQRSYFTYPDGFEEDIVSGTTPSSETQLVCNNPSVSHSLIRSSQIAGGTALTVRYTYTASGLSNDRPAIFRLNDRGNVSSVKTPFLFSGSTFRWRIESYPYAGNAGTYGALEYILLGQNFTIPLYADNSRDSNNLSISAALVAAEYWPYDPGDGGGPIYDSVTGAQLRGFPV
jgi:hypothetical protein